MSSPGSEALRSDDGRLGALFTVAFGAAVMGAGLFLRVHASFGLFPFLDDRIFVYATWLLLAAAGLSAWGSRPRGDGSLDWGLLPLAAVASVAMEVFAELQPRDAGFLRAAALEAAGGFTLLVGMTRFLRARARLWIRPFRRPSRTRIRFADEPDLKGDSLSAGDLAPGDRVRLRAGAHIPVDGVIERGSGSIDEQVVHGAVHAIQKVEGDFVYEGSTSGAPEIAVRVAAPSGRSLLSQVERQTDRVADALTYVSGGARSWSMVTALIVLANAALLVLLSDVARVSTWLPDVAALWLVAPLATLGLAQAVGYLEALALLRMHGLFISREEDLIALTHPRDFFVDPLLLAAPGWAEVVTLADVPQATLLSVATALTRESEGMEYATLKRTLDHHGLVTAGATGVSFHRGVWSGTIDDGRWFVGTREAIAREKALPANGSEVPPVGSLEDRSSLVLMVCRDPGGLVGALGLDLEVDEHVKWAADKLDAALVSESPDPIHAAVAEVSGLSAGKRPLDRRDVCIIREEQPAPSAVTRLRLMAPRMPFELPDSGAPRFLRPALAGLVPALACVTPLFSRMGHRTSVVGLVPPILGSVLAHLSLLSPVAATGLGVVALAVAGARYGLSFGLGGGAGGPAAGLPPTT